MDTDEHPLLQLSAEHQRDLASLVEDDRITELADETGRSRREILGVLATLGAGAAVGGVTLEELVGVVEAGADTDDGDGNVGTPSNRVDVFADGVDAASVRADELNSGGPVTDGDGIERRIWLIPAGASDPEGAGPDDLIFEEET